MKTLLVYSELSGFAIQIKNHIFSALEELEVETKECYIDHVKEVSDSFQPTMHIFLHHQHKLYEKLEVIKSLKGHKLLWTMEDPYESDITFDMLPHFYYVFTSDENTAKALQKESQSNLIKYVPHACNPKVHRPVEVPFSYRQDIAFIGNAYPSRVQYFQRNAEEFKKETVTIVGVGYRGLDGYQNQRVIHGHISEEEMVKYICGSKGYIPNIHRLNTDLDMANSRKIEATSLNNRFYEIWACGKKQKVIGRGEERFFEGDWKEAHEKHSYKARLVEYYLPLLSK